MIGTSRRAIWSIGWTAHMSGRKGSVRQRKIPYPKKTWIIRKTFVATNLLLPLLILSLELRAMSYSAQEGGSGFDTFGPVTIRFREHENARKLSAELREFVWRHWHERRRGQAVVTEISVVHPVPCTSTFTIQSDEEDKWHIEKRTKCRKWRAKTDRTVVHSVERIERDRNGHRTERVLPDTADVPPESYVLVLRDEAGEIVREL